MLRKYWQLVVAVACGFALGFVTASSRSGTWRSTGDGRTIVNDRTGAVRIAATGESVEEFQRRQRKEARAEAESNLEGSEYNMIALEDVDGAASAQETILQIQAIRYRDGRRPLDLGQVKLMAPNWAKHQVGRTKWKDVARIVDFDSEAKPDRLPAK